MKLAARYYSTTDRGLARLSYSTTSSCFAVAFAKRSNSSSVRQSLSETNWLLPDNEPIQRSGAKDLVCFGELADKACILVHWRNARHVQLRSSPSGENR